MEPTLLLVDVERLPRGLEEQLTSKGVFVETTNAGQLGFAVVAAAPDLVVGPHSPDLERMLEAMRRQEPPVPLVVVADWKSHKGLRARQDPVIGALVAEDTPLGILAGRLFEFAERARNGRPLGPAPTATRVEPARTEPARTAPARTEPARTEPARVEPARVELPRTESARTEAPLARPPSLVPAAISSRRSPTSIVVAPTPAQRPTHPAVPAALGRAPAVRTIETRATARALAPALRAIEPTRDPAPELPAERSETNAPSSDRVERKPEPSERVPEQSERIPLTASTRPLPPVRLALVDADPTRAGAISDELRRRGVFTQLVAPRLDATRWHLLRRFSPHGLIVDETAVGSLSDWLETIRLDPFLRHVPLITAPFSRIFRESSGRADVGFLVPLASSLGSEEFQLGERLGPRRELEIRLDQIGPIRLLECLAAHRSPTRFECRAGSARLVGRVHSGSLESATVHCEDGSHETLTPPEILEWWLAHPEVRVVVTESNEPPTSSGATSVESLLEAATVREVIPVVPRRSTRPPAPAAVVDLSTPLAVTAVEFTSAATDVVTTPERVEPRPRFVVRARRTASDALDAFEARVPRPARFALGFGVLLLIALALWMASHDASKENVPPPVAPRAAPARPIAPAAPSAEEIARENERLRFTVTDSRRPGCGDALPPDGFAMARVHLQNARKALMAGENETARQLMCKAAQLDPAGPASEGLAVIYLSERSLENATTWARVVERNRPEERTTRELLGDVANQSGDVARSRALWLESMGLSGSETEKLGAVSKSLLRDAQRAEKSRDLPRAERLLRRAATLDPTHVAAAIELGELFLGDGSLDLAERWAKHVLVLEARESRAWLVLGAVAERRGDHERARAHYTRILDTDPNAPRARERLARLPLAAP